MRYIFEKPKWCKGFSNGDYIKWSHSYNESYRCIPQNLYEQVKNYIDDSVINEWVKQWNSTYASPIVCVCKKHGRLCLCFDYHKLNNKTIPDRQPIPKIQDMLDCLRGKQWFSALDMSKVY